MRRRLLYLEVITRPRAILGHRVTNPSWVCPGQPLLMQLLAGSRFLLPVRPSVGPTQPTLPSSQAPAWPPLATGSYGTSEAPRLAAAGGWSSVPAALDNRNQPETELSVCRPGRGGREKDGLTD